MRGKDTERVKLEMGGLGSPPRAREGRILKIVRRS